MGGALPCAIAFICSLAIWKNFQRRGKCRVMIVINNDTGKRRKTRDQQIIAMLLVQVGIFFISTVPFMSFNIYDTMTKSVPNKSADRKALESLLKTLTELLVYSITLSLYSNTLVSKNFRKELYTLFRLTLIWQHCELPSRVSPSNNTVPKNSTLPILASAKTVNTSSALESTSKWQ